MPFSQYLLLPVPPPQTPKYAHSARQRSTPERISACMRKNASLVQTDARASSRTLPSNEAPVAFRGHAQEFRVEGREISLIVDVEDRERRVHVRVREPPVEVNHVCERFELAQLEHAAVGFGQLVNAPHERTVAFLGGPPHRASSAC